MLSQFIIGALVSGGLALVGVLIQQRAQKTMARQNATVAEQTAARREDVERDRIESQAYERARSSYEAGIRSMSEEAVRRDTQHAQELKYLNDRLAERNQRILELESQVADMRAQVTEMRNVTQRMERRLTATETAITKTDRRADVAEIQADTDREDAGNGGKDS